MSEDLPLPSVIDIAPGKKEAVLAQYYRANTSSSGITITIGSTVFGYLPVGAFNQTQSTLGMSEFPSTNSVTLNRAGSYIHNIQIYGRSANPITGIIGVDLINSAGNQYGSHIFSTKNWNNASANDIGITSIIKSNAGANFRLRFGGGLVGTGAAYNIQILSIIWTISEK